MRIKLLRPSKNLTEKEQVDIIDHAIIVQIEFSHDFCPACVREMFPELRQK